jgi:hypothetical protein
VKRRTENRTGRVSTQSRRGTRQQDARRTGCRAGRARIRHSRLTVEMPTAQVRKVLCREGASRKD